MTLHYRKQGNGEPVIILHGLFGMLDNWQTLARRFAGKFEVYSPDLRNHGKSPHSVDMDYHLMAQDVVDLMDDLGLEMANVIGHSMGGKVAMQMGVSFPERVKSLIAVDIAPKSYPPYHGRIFDALAEADPDRAETRQDILDFLMQRLNSLPIALLIMKNLARRKEGGFAWKMNLNAIRINYDKIIGEIEEDQIYDGPALFIRGENSDYVQDDDIDGIQEHFPNARLVTIPDAGHWVHADEPDALYEAVVGFLG